MSGSLRNSLPRYETPYLTAGQVAKLLGVSRSTIYRLVNTGDLQPSAMSPDGHMVFTREHVEAFKARHAGQVADDVMSGMRGAGSPVEGS